jgi:hypothetical protein
MTKPLTAEEQDVVLKVADEMGARLAAGMSAMLSTFNEDMPESTVKAFDRKTRENFAKVARMSPDEYEQYQREQKAITRLYEIRQDLVDCSEELRNAQWKYKRARKAAREAKVTVNDSFEMLQVRGRQSVAQS